MKDYTAERAELEELSREFEGLEAASLSMTRVEAPQRLIVRCDGVKLSKRFLKDALKNPRFDDALRRSVCSVFAVLGRMIPRGAPLLIQRVLILSDEVSFVLSTGDNYYNRRVMKLTTLLGGTLSSAMTGQFEFPRLKRRRKRHSDAYPELICFDARPIVVEGDELERYLRWRWLLFLRNEMSKVLRLRSSLTDEEIYATSLRTDPAALWAALGDHGLQEIWTGSTGGAWLGWPTGSGERPELVGQALGRQPELVIEVLPDIDAVPT